MQSNIVRMPVETKVCKKCGEAKALSEFHKNAGYPDGRLNKCRDCNRPDAKRREYYSAYQKARRKKIMENPVAHAELKEKKNAWNRTDKYYDMYYGKRFGISYKEVLSMLARQNGLCANIGCSKSIVVPPAEGDRACVDHCHTTGKVRGLLCVRCNTTLGHIERNHNLIPGLMDYINKHR